MSRNLVTVRRMLYALKQQYGLSAAIYRITPGSTDLETGAKSITKVKYSIDNVIVMPSKAETVSFYSAPLLKAGRDFAYGGFQDQDTKFMIIDGEDLPVGFEILQTDSIVYDHKKFEIVSVQEIEDEAGYYLTCKHLRGEAPGEVHEVQVFQRLRMVQGVAHGS